MPNSVEFKNRINELIVYDEKEKVKTCQSIGVDARAITLAKEYGIIPSIQALIKIADYYNVPVHFVLGLTDEDVFIPSKVPVTFAERLSKLIQEENISAYKLSQKCHIDKSSFSKWLKGSFIASINHLEVLADYFNVSIDYLLGRTDEEKYSGN